MSAQQLPLFPTEGATGEYGPPLSPTPALTARSSLAAAIGGFHDQMVRQRFTENTIRAFRSDLRLLTRFLGTQRVIGEIAARDLQDFLAWLLYRRGVPCNPKSYSRRVTTLKVFFGWLVQEGIIPYDPAASLIHQRVSTPLPRILYEGQVASLLEATRALMEAEEKPDARPHLLVTLLLHTGIKKGECMAIRLDHMDLSDPKSPVLYIRYANPRMRKKERKLKLPPEFPAVLERYLAQYQPQERLFECTARNLEYVLHNAAERASIKSGASFEALRMTCAVRDYKAGMPLETLRQKLGLSSITWADTAEKIKKLAAPPL